MDLTHLGDGVQKRKLKKRVGRGIGSGHGKTATRGHKGQYASAGAGMPHVLFIGSSFPLHRRFPKRGFSNATFAKVYAEVNVEDLERFDAGTAIDMAKLKEVRLVNGTFDGVRILGNGDLTKKLAVTADHFTKSAQAKIEAQGGSVAVIPTPKKPVRNKMGQGKNSVSPKVPNLPKRQVGTGESCDGVYNLLEIVDIMFHAESSQVYNGALKLPGGSPGQQGATMSIDQINKSPDKIVDLLEVEPDLSTRSLALADIAARDAILGGACVLLGLERRPGAVDWVECLLLQSEEARFPSPTKQKRIADAVLWGIAAVNKSHNNRRDADATVAMACGFRRFGMSAPLTDIGRLIPYMKSVDLPVARMAFEAVRTMHSVEPPVQSASLNVVRNTALDHVNHWLHRARSVTDLPHISAAMCAAVSVGADGIEAVLKTAQPPLDLFEARHLHKELSRFVNRWPHVPPAGIGEERQKILGRLLDALPLADKLLGI